MDANTIALILIGVSGFLLFCAVVGFLGWYIYIFRFPHQVEFIRIRDKTEQVIVKRARDAVNKHLKVKVWKLRFPKNLPVKELPVPNDKFLALTDKGKNYLRCYIMESGDIIFTTAKHPKFVESLKEALGEIPKDIKDEKDAIEKQKLYDEWKKDKLTKLKREVGDDLVVFQPYTTNHRVMQVSELTKANDRRKKSSKDFLNTLLQLAPTIILALVLIMGFVYWKDLNEPGLQKEREITKQKEIDLQTAKELNEISRQLDEVASRLGNENGQQAPG